MSHLELEKRVMGLFHSIAKSNTMKEAIGKTVGDFITIENAPARITHISASSRVDEGSYFLVAEQAQKLNEICIDISETNKTIVSAEDARRYLGELIWEMKRNNWNRRGILESIRKTLKNIEQNKGQEAVVTVPVWGLIVGYDTLLVGDVEFKPKSFAKEIDEELEIYDPEGKGVHTVAVTTARGDTEMLFANAVTKVNRAINILRAFAFPIISAARLQEIGIEGDYRQLRSFGKLEYKLKDEKGIYTTSIYNLMVGGKEPLEIKSIIDYMNHLGFGELLKIMGRNDSFSQGLVKGAEWIGEATKQDVLQAKFVKVAFAIDAMIGDAAKDIADKGQKARIAERAAFLLGKNYKVRDLVWKKVDNIMKKRNMIAHGHSAMVTQYEVAESGRYARGILKELLFREPKFKHITSLAEWVKKQSFKG